VRVSFSSKTSFPQKLPLPYPPYQINDLAGNPGTPSLQGREKEIRRTSSKRGRENSIFPPLSLGPFLFSLSLDGRGLG